MKSPCKPIFDEIGLKLGDGLPLTLIRFLSFFLR